MKLNANAGKTPPESPLDKEYDFDPEKAASRHAPHDDNGITAYPGGITPYPTVASQRPAMVPPELVAAMSPERRIEAEKALRRKIDLRLMPMAVLMYIMNYLDRNNIAAARLGGLQEDLSLTDTEYSTCVSILFVGYVLMQLPSNLYLNKMGKPALYLPICMIIWGIISTATAACQNFSGLVACRFFLGFIEAAYFPGCLYYLSCWYTREELGFRYSILYSGSLISGAFSGLIAAGVNGNMEGLHGFRSWRWLFIIEGTITVGIAFAAFWVLPNFPRTTKWLTEEERQLAAWRLEEDIGEDDWVDSEHQSFLNGAKLAFKDVKMWVLMVILFGVSASGSVTNFFPSVVQTLGFGKVQTLLLTAPPYVLCVFTTYLNAWHADKTGERYFHIILPLGVAVVSFILAVATTATAPRYVAMMLMVPGIYSGYVVCLSWISNTLPRPPAKRAASLALINCISNTSSIYSSYMYADAAPRYIVAMAVNCGTAVLAILGSTVLMWMLRRLNRQLDRGMIVDEGEEVDHNGIPTAAAKKGFRYRV